MLQSFINWYKINYKIDKYELTNIELTEQLKTKHRFNAVINCYDKKENLIFSKPFEFQMACRHSSKGIILEEYWYFETITNFHPLPQEGFTGYWHIARKIEKDFFQFNNSNLGFDYSTKKFVPKDLTRLDGKINLKDFLS